MKFIRSICKIALTRSVPRVLHMVYANFWKKILFKVHVARNFSMTLTCIVKVIVLFIQHFTFLSSDY